MNEISIENLEISNIIKIWWGFMWRAILTTIGSMLVGGALGWLFGVITGFIGSLIDGTQEMVVIIATAGGILGLISGIYSFYLYLRWLLTSKFGNYKLVLIDIRSSF
jgi:hypothetical protein